MKKAKLGSDVSKPATGYVASRDFEYDEDNQLQPIITYRECIDELFVGLDQQGYQFIASPSGAYCGFELYAKTRPDIRDLVIPSDFYYYKKVSPSDISHSTVMHLIREFCEYKREGASKKVSATWENILLCFEDRPRDTQSPVAKIAISRLNSKRIGTLTGKAGYHKVVPPLSWFPDNLQTFNPTELLTLFPEAERNQFCLLLGRALVGADNTETAEGTIFHTSRGYALIVGTEGGLGKSTLMRYIQECAEELGYTFSYLNPNFGKFGWASVALSDFGVIDDLNDELQKELLHSAIIKSIVSNNYIKVEEKGIPAIDVRSTTTLFACSNTINYHHYIGMDSGSLSRVNQLYTYMSHELEDKYTSDARTPAYWAKVARLKKTNIKTLTARLFRHCVDLFLEATGHTLTDRGLIVKDMNQDGLEALVKANRDQFRIDVSLTHAEQLPKALSTLIAWALTHQEPEAQDRLLKKLKRCDFSPELLVILLELWVYTPDGFSPEVDDLNLNHLSTDVRRYLKPKLGAFRNMASDKTLDRAFMAITEELKASKGFGYPLKSAHYQQLWLQYKKQIPKKMAQLKDVPLQGNSDSFKRLLVHLDSV